MDVGQCALTPLVLHPLSHSYLYIAILLYQSAPWLYLLFDCLFHLFHYSIIFCLSLIELISFPLCLLKKLWSGLNHSSPFLVFPYDATTGIRARSLDFEDLTITWFLEDCPPLDLHFWWYKLYLLQNKKLYFEINGSLNLHSRLKMVVFTNRHHWTGPSPKIKRKLGWNWNEKALTKC